MTRAAVLSVALLLAVQGGFGLYVVSGGRPVAGDPLVDVATYYLAGVAVSRGIDPYTIGNLGWAALARDSGIDHFAPPYRYPPLVAGVFAHLTWLPFHTAALLWMLLSVAALVVTGLALSRACCARVADPLTFVALAGFGPAANSLYTGQADLIVLACVALLVALPAVRGAVAFGASVVVKPLAAPLAALLLLRRDVTRLAGSLVGGAVALVAAVVLAGPAALASYVASSWRLSTLPADAIETHPNNASLLAEVGRLGAGASAAAPIAIAVVVVTLFLTWRATSERAVAVAIPATLLGAPIVWYHDASLAFVPLALLWPTATHAIRGLLLAAYVLLASHAVLWRAVDAVAPALDLATLGLLALFAAAALSTRPAAK